MRNYFFGIVALILAIGISSFTAEHPKNSDNKKLNVKFFRIVHRDYLEGDAVLKADAEYLSDSDPGNSGCSGSAKQCISTFDASTQVDANNELIGTSQTPAGYPYKKS